MSKYRPSNGTEGEWFIEHWCGRCKRDEAFRNDEGDSCPIVANTFVYDVDDPNYPVEWQWGQAGPLCTAFEEIGGPQKRDENAATADLFAADRETGAQEGSVPITEKHHE